jgi:histidinol-phosphate aminotransferase
LELYPDLEAIRLRQTIANHHGLAFEHIFVGNDFDEVLAHAFFTLFQQGYLLLIPDTSCGFYPVYCQLYDIPVSL